MKKLMIAACAAMLGFAANASSVEWAVNAIWLSGEDGSWEGTFAQDGYSVYVFDANGAVSYGTAAAALALGDTSFMMNDSVAQWADMGVTYVSDDKGVVNNTSGDKFALQTGNKVQAYAIIYDAASYDVAQNAFLVDIAEGEDMLSGAAVDLTGMNGTGFGPDSDAWIDARSGWQKVGAIPEPTSGLLLLLGVAGLALRRRRA